jgi:hypothetical protein
MKEHFDTVFKILLLVVLVWIALEIRGIYIPHEIDVNAAHGSFEVELIK